jgi:hypothetical protein
MSFTDGKPHVVTHEDLTRPWSGHTDGSHFRCYLCGHRFKVGDVFRWQFTNNVKGAGGNPFVCERCDGPDVVGRWKAMREEWERDCGGKWWWFVDQEAIRGRATR